MVQVLKKLDGIGNQVVNDKLFINEKKPSSTSAVKSVLNNGEYTLILPYGMVNGLF